MPAMIASLNQAAQLQMLIRLYPQLAPQIFQFYRQTMGGGPPKPQ
jgi:hypothetical protein